MEQFRHTIEKGDGSPILFLHGWSANSRFFEPQLELAALGRRIIAPDLPGHGHDRRPSARITIAGMADALHHFIERRDLKQAVLVGWSMGAMVAFDYIARFGAGRLAALVVVDMSARILNDGAWNLGIASGLDAARSEAEAVLMAKDWPRYSGRIVRNLFAPQIDREHPLHRFATAEIAANDGETLAHIWRSLAQADHRGTLERIAAPSLVIAGAESQIYRPEVTEWVAQRLPRAEHHVISAGHAPQLEQPQRFNEALAGWIATLGL